MPYRGYIAPVAYPFLFFSNATVRIFTSDKLVTKSHKNASIIKTFEN